MPESESATAARTLLSSRSKLPPLTISSVSCSVGTFMILPLRSPTLRNKKEGLRGIEWVILGLDTEESCAFPRYFALRLDFESSINVGWHEQRSEGGGCGMHIRS